MKLHCDRAFAAPAKLATSGATNGNLPVRGVRTGTRNDKGALRMNVGMRVRGGLLAALIMFAMPVAATLAAMLVSRLRPPRPCLRSRSRATAASKSRPSAPISSRVPAGAWTRPQIDDGLKALIETGLFQDVQDQPCGRPAGGDRGGKPGDRPHRLRGQQEGQGRAAFGGNPVQAARHAVAPDGAVRRPAHRRNLSPLRPLRRPRQSRRSSSSRTTASIWFSRSPRAQKTGVKSIEFIGNSAYSSYRLRTSSRRANRTC